MQLLIIKFVYNNSIYLVTLITLFKAYYKADLNKPKQLKIPLSKRELLISKEFTAYILNLQAKYYRKILASNAYQKAY